METFDNVVASFPTTHSFTYNGSQFSFNMSLFNCFTDYFTTHPNEVQQDNTIRLFEGLNEQNIHFSNESVNDFIQFCQYQKIQINNDNVVPINYLSKKYNVERLIECTSNYITLHQKELSLQLLSLYQNSESIEIEEIIAKNLLDYIDNDMLMNLSLPTLNRILKKYKIYKQKQNLVQNENKILDFLLNYLEKNGRKASVLFSYVDLSYSKSEYYHRLLTEFADSFDFHFINSDFLKTIYEQQNEILKNFEKMKNQHENLMNDILSEKNKLKTESDKLREENKKLSEEVELMRDERNKMKIETNSMKEQSEKLIKEVELMREENQKLKDVANTIIEENKEVKIDVELMREENKKLKETTELMKEENKKLKDETNLMREENKKLKEQDLEEIKESLSTKTNILNQIQDEINIFLPKIFKYDDNEGKRFNGIIHFLTESCGGNVNDKGIVDVSSSSEFSNSHLCKYAVDLEDKSHIFASKSEPNSWLKYDFKEKKVHPTYYSIRTRHKFDHQHPKTWVIEGSNNNNDWKILDSRENQTCLKGLNLEHTFDIQTKLEITEFFRYIRIKQTGKNTNGDNVLVLSALEYFGYLI